MARARKPSVLEAAAPCALALWWCRRLPHSALITEAQCGRNHERAERATRSTAMRSHSVAMGEVSGPAAIVLVNLAPCVGCPGVVAVAKKRGQRLPDRLVERVRAAPAAAAKGELAAPCGGKRRYHGIASLLESRWRDR